MAVADAVEAADAAATVANAKLKAERDKLALDLADVEQAARVPAEEARLSSEIQQEAVAALETKLAAAEEACRRAQAALTASSSEAAIAATEEGRRPSLELAAAKALAAVEGAEKLGRLTAEAESLRADAAETHRRLDVKRRVAVGERAAFTHDLEHCEEAGRACEDKARRDVARLEARHAAVSVASKASAAAKTEVALRTARLTSFQAQANMSDLRQLLFASAVASQANLDSVSAERDAFAGTHLPWRFNQLDLTSPPRPTQPTETSECSTTRARTQQPAATTLPSTEIRFVLKTPSVRSPSRPNKNESAVRFKALFVPAKRLHQGMP